MRRIGCAILAAGAGRRFGAPGEKLVARVLRKPLLQHAVDAACASPVLTCSLILGAAAEFVRATIDTRRCAVVLNPRWSEGIASSIRCAVAVLADTDGCLMMLGDQPRVDAVDLGRLAAQFERRPDSIVALRCGDVWGAPVLFPRSDFAALEALRGDAGAKRYAASQIRRVVFVDALRPDAFTDVDVANDLQDLR